MILFLDEDILHKRLGLLDSKANFWAHQALLSMESSRQEYWSGLTFPSSGDPTQIFCIAGRFFIVWATREAPWNKKEVNSDLQMSSFRVQICCFLDGFQVHIFIAIYELLKAKDMGDCTLTDNWVSLSVCERIIKDSP